MSAVCIYTHCREHLLGIGIAQTPLVSTGYRSAEGGEYDYIIGMFSKDLFQPFPRERHSTEPARLLKRDIKQKAIIALIRELQRVNFLGR